LEVELVWPLLLAMELAMAQLKMLGLGWGSVLVLIAKLIGL
jgi:hypothetical protein